MVPSAHYGVILPKGGPGVNRKVLPNITAQSWRGLSFSNIHEGPAQDARQRVPTAPGSELDVFAHRERHRPEQAGIEEGIGFLPEAPTDEGHAAGGAGFAFWQQMSRRLSAVAPVHAGAHRHPPK